MTLSPPLPSRGDFEGGRTSEGRERPYIAEEEETFFSGEKGKEGTFIKFSEAEGDGGRSMIKDLPFSSLYCTFFITPVRFFSSRPCIDEAKMLCSNSSN